MALASQLDKPVRTLGGEFECCVPIVGNGSNLDVQRQIASILTSNGIRAGYRGYSHLPLPPNIDVMVETDASVRGESRYMGISWATLEVKTRILQGITEYEQIIPKTLEILRALNCKVNSSTGHHLHIGYPEARSDPNSIRSLYNLVHRFEPVILSLVAPSRRDNRYCRPLPDVSKLLHKCKDFECYERTLNHLDRYQGWNWTHLFDSDGSSRIEVRFHSGTLDKIKAIHWARLCVQLLNHASTRSCQSSPEQIPGTKEGLKKMLGTCGLKVNTKVYAKVCPELRETGRYFLIKRWKQLNGSTTDERANSSDQEG